MHKRISEGASLLAIALLNVADDEGRFEADPGQIGAQLFNRRALSVPVDEALQELAEQRFLVLYVAKLDGHQTELGQILGFRDHAAPWGQVINKPSASLLPAPDKGLLREAYGSDTGAVISAQKEPRRDGGRNTTEPFTPSMDGRMDRKGEDGGRDGSARTHLDFPEAEIPSLEEVLMFCNGAAGIPEATGRAFFEYYEKTALPPWTDGASKRFQWRGKLESWAARDREKTGGSKKTAEEKNAAQAEAERGAAREEKNRGVAESRRGNG